MKKKYLVIILSLVTLVLTACGMSQSMIHVPNIYEPGVYKAMEAAAVRNAYYLGYHLDSNIRGNLSFSKKVVNNEYYIRVTLGNIQEIGDKPGFIVKSWTKYDLVNPFVSGNRKDMEEAIKRAAGL